MAIKAKTFTDIDLTFDTHPGTGDIFLKYDETAIKNAVKNLIVTKHFERPFHSEIGSSVTSLLFENPNPGIVSIISQEIMDVIKNFEPRVVVTNVYSRFRPDYLTLDVTIEFRIVNTTTPVTIELALERTR